jgi:flagellar hook-length control protein FliK
MLELIDRPPEGPAPGGAMAGRGPRGRGAASGELGFADWLDLAQRGDETDSADDSLRSGAASRERSPEAKRETPEHAAPASAAATDTATSQAAAERASEPEAEDADVDVEDGAAQAAAQAAQQAAAAAAAEAPVAIAAAPSTGLLLATAEAESEPAVEPSGSAAAAWRTEMAGELGAAAAETAEGGGDAPEQEHTNPAPAEIQASAVPPASGPDLSRSLQLLSTAELLDPELSVDTQPTQLLSRLHQALTAGTASTVVDEVADAVMPQVIRGLATLVRNGAAEMRVALQPPDLGEIELRVRTTQGMVRGEMMVQHAEIKQLLDANMGRLRAALAQDGLDLGGFDVDVERDTQFADQHGQQQPSRAAGRSRRAGGVVDNASVPDAPAGPARVGADDGVDYTI